MGIIEDNSLNKTVETYQRNFDKYVERNDHKMTAEFKKWMHLGIFVTTLDKNYRKP